MKKIYIAIYLIFVFASLEAQVNTYFKTAVSGTVQTANLRSKGVADTKLDYDDPLIRPGIGVGLEYEFWGQRMILTGGIEWTIRGYNNKPVDADVSSGAKKGQVAHMVSFPINIGYKLTKNFNIYTGARIENNIWKNKNYVILYPNSNRACVYNSLTAGLNFGAEYKIRKTSIGIEYYHGMTSYRNEDLFFSSLVNKAYYRSLSLYARFSFMK